MDNNLIDVCTYNVCIPLYIRLQLTKHYCIAVNDKLSQ